MPSTTDNPSVLRLPLTRGAYTTIDTGDWPLIAGYPWHLVTPSNGLQYAQTTFRDAAGRSRHETLHRILTGAPRGVDVDHINGDGLDNRRANLRLGSHAQNMQNRGPSAHSTTGLRNVYRRPSGRYTVEMYVAGRLLYGGIYATPADADTVARALRAQHMPYSPEASEVPE